MVDSFQLEAETTIQHPRAATLLLKYSNWWGCSTDALEKPWWTQLLPPHLVWLYGRTTNAFSIITSNFVLSSVKPELRSHTHRGRQCWMVGGLFLLEWQGKKTCSSQNWEMLTSLNYFFSVGSAPQKVKKVPYPFIICPILGKIIFNGKWPVFV